jgi:hypothetical protein
MALYVSLAVAAALIVLLVIFIASRPADFRVVRSATINAAPDEVFPQVNDLHNWEAWSPWAKLDPAMKQTYDGAPAGVGAIYSWNGNSNVGEGKMTVTDSKPTELVRIRLEFKRPFAAVNNVEFTFMPQGSQTTVSWSMEGKLNFMTKAFGLFMSMEKMVGGMYEQGLAQMKTVVETKKTAVAS